MIIVKLWLILLDLVRKKGTTCWFVFFMFGGLLGLYCTCITMALFVSHEIESRDCNINQTANQSVEKGYEKKKCMIGAFYYSIAKNSIPPLKCEENFMKCEYGSYLKRVGELISMCSSRRV